MPAATGCQPSRSQLALWKSLEKAASRHQAGLFLAEGCKVVQELLKSNWKTVTLLVMEEKKKQWEVLLSTAPEEVAVYDLTAAQWEKISQDKNPEGIMAVAALVPRTGHSLLPASGHVILAYRTNNPNNLGALMRTAHWFGFGTILLSTDCVDFANPKVVRASMGSLFDLNILSDLDFATVIPALKGHYLLIAGDVTMGVKPHPCAQPTALLLGSESHGLPDELLAMADESWSIPGAGTAESLSLPQAAAVMMYEIVKTK